MVREIMKDEAFLAQPSEAATPEDLPVAADLLDTLAAHKDACVGMAANMIGVRRRIIVVDDEGCPLVMFNPEILRKTDAFQAREGCLSLSGVRETTRWKFIKVKYRNEAFQERIKGFRGWTAQIIQHELDHCNGILI